MGVLDAGRDGRVLYENTARSGVGLEKYLDPLWVGSIRTAMSTRKTPKGSIT